jgi:RNA 2',3'-cyclic 3'-phosphodiesterase
MRCFVALWPTAEQRDALARAVRIPAGCRPVPPANYHLTLCFLGEVPDGRVPAVAEAVAALPVAPFSFELDSVGRFARAGVAWVGPSADSPPLAALAREVVARVSAAGFDFDAREFRPHVTVARHCRGPALAWQGPPLGWPVDGVALCRSEGTDTGVRYLVVARTAPASVR